MIIVMEKFKYDKHPSHLTEDEYKKIINFINQATDEEIQNFLRAIKVNFERGNAGIDKEQVVFVVNSDTNDPEIKKGMMNFINSKL